MVHNLVGCPDLIEMEIIDCKDPLTLPLHSPKSCFFLFPGVGYRLFICHSDRAKNRHDASLVNKRCARLNHLRHDNPS